MVKGKYQKYPYEKIVAIDPYTLKFKEYPSISSTYFDGFNPAKVSACINGHQKTHRGIIFKRITKDD
jgi:hypothetical protein